MKVLLFTHSYGPHGAAVMLFSLARYWIQKMGWHIDALVIQDLPSSDIQLLKASGIGQIDSLVPNHGYDFVLINTLIDAPYIELLSSALPVVLWVHEGTTVVNNKNPAVTSWSRWFAMCHRVIFQSKWQSEIVFCDFLREMPADRINIIPNGLPDIGLEFRTSKIHNPFRIISVGSLYGRKRQGDLAQAVVEISSRHNVTCDFVGDVQAIDTLGYENVQLMRSHSALHIKGAMLRQDTLERVRDSDIFVLCSGDESQPLTPLESAMLGVPVILADLEVYRYFGWKHEENCLMYPVGNVSILSECVERLINDGTLYKKLAHAGIKFATEFDMSHFLNLMTQMAVETAQSKSSQQFMNMKPLNKEAHMKQVLMKGNSVQNKSIEFQKNNMNSLNKSFNQLVQTRYGPMLYNRFDQYVGGSLAAYGEFSEGEAAMFSQLVGNGNIVVEAGANIGAHTVHLAQMVGEQGAIYAFEPQRVVFQTLCANLALNQLVNVTARQQGLGRNASEMVLPNVDPRVENNFGGLSLLQNVPGEKVSIVTIDSLALPRCDLIKVDVEGMEEEVIAGALNTIAKFRPTLYLENDRAEKSASLIRFLQSLNYKIWWHLSPLFNPNNFAKNSTNIFGGIVSINILCQPAESAKPVTGLREILDANEQWNRPA